MLDTNEVLLHLSEDYWAAKLFDAENDAVELYSAGFITAVVERVNIAEADRVVSRIARGNALGKLGIYTSLFSMAIQRVFGLNEVMIASTIPVMSADKRDRLLFFQTSTDLTLKHTIRRIQTEINKSLKYEVYRYGHLLERLHSDATVMDRALRFGIFLEEFGCPSELFGETGISLSILNGAAPVAEFRSNGRYADRFILQAVVRLFAGFLQALGSSPDTPVYQLRLLNEVEERQILVEFNATFGNYPRDKSMLALWREQLGHTPLATALVYGDERLSYQEVDSWSSRVAGWLADQGLLPEERVAVVMDRTIRSIVAILAVLKAGGAFVPLDPAWPQERKLLLLEDAGCRLVLGGEALPESSTEVDAVFGPESLAYVIYTSGSTGRPKGVLVEQEALIDHIYGGIGRKGLDGCRRYALAGSLVADGNLSILFSALLLGGELHLLSEELVLDGNRLGRYLREQEIDCVRMVPSQWLSYGEGESYPLPGKVLILGGETFPAGIVDRLREHDYQGRVFNHYGPTEVTIGKSVYEVDLTRKYDRVPIGRPFANGRLYILDREGRLLPVGVPGELHIGGKGLARGYLNQPELTAEKFVADPFVPGGRMYKTGDLCRWLPDGNMEYWGRMDGQVKVRGYRIEPGEIEGVVLQSGLVQQVTVAVWQERLLGYVVGKGFDKEKLIDYLNVQLPEYMIPRLWVELEAMPLTRNGKVDKKGLPAPTLSSGEGSYVAPRTIVELELTGIWQEVLGAERIGVNDNFFSLGGHSLIAIKILNKTVRLIDDLALRDLFSHPTIAGLSRFLEEKRRIRPGAVSLLSSIPLAPAMEHYPVSSGQLRLWVLQQLYPGNYSYNIVHQYTYAGVLDAERLQQALDIVVARHEILRTRFVEVDGEPRQVILAPEAGRIVAVWSRQSLTDALGQESRHVFDLTTGPLLRVQVVSTPEDVHRLVVNIHHIITDEWSTEVLLREWMESLRRSSAVVAAADPVQGLCGMAAGAAIGFPDGAVPTFLDGAICR